MLGWRAHVKRKCSGRGGGVGWEGSEVSVRAGAQWGQGGAPSATTNPPTPSAEVDGVLLWKHGYTQALFFLFSLNHNQYIYIRHEETNEINRFGFLSSSLTPGQGSLSIFSVVCPLRLLSLCVNNKPKTSRYICGLQRNVSFKSFIFLKRKKEKEKKKKIASISVTPPTLTMQWTTLTLTRWPGYKGHSELTKLALWK